MVLHPVLHHVVFEIVKLNTYCELTDASELTFATCRSISCLVCGFVGPSGSGSYSLAEFNPVVSAIFILCVPTVFSAIFCSRKTIH